MTVKIDAFAKRAAIGLKTLPHPLDLTAYRQFLYGIFSWEDRASMQLSNKTAIAIKKLSVTRALPRGTSRIPAFGRSRLLSVNHLGPTTRPMDTDAPHPYCPFCGLAMRFRRTSPNFGAQSPLQTFVCDWCGVVLNIPPQAALESATPILSRG